MAQNKNSEVIIVKGIKMDREYRNILSISESNLVSLCRSLKVASASNFSFVRNGVPIDVPFTYNECLQSNYIAFQNPTYSNKWFFAWIDKVEYVGERNTRISYTVDSWSTWQDKLVKKACFVEREHVIDDSVGKHLIDEGLATKNFRTVNATFDPLYLQDPYLVVLSTYDLEAESDMAGASIYNGTVIGCKAYIFQYNSTGLLNFEKYLLKTNTKDKIASIQNIFLVPYALVGQLDTETSLVTKHTFPDGLGGVMSYYTYRAFSFNPVTFQTHLQHLFDDFSYQPHNNKCKCYPYHYLFVTNNSGNNNIYKIEQFNDINDIKFENQVVFSVGCSCRIFPLNYKGYSNNYDEAIALGKYPNCGWSNDQYINWLTANAINEPTKIINSLMGIGSSYSSYSAKEAKGTATGFDEASLGLSAVTSVAGLIGDFYSASLLPSTSAGSNLGDVNFSSNSLRFDFYNVVLCDEELKIIDDYFTRFGYKVNSNKIPEFNSRTYWNYIKIASGENIGYGEIPSNDMDIINKIFRNGVSLWHSHSNLGDFSLANWL